MFWYAPMEISEGTVVIVTEKWDSETVPTNHDEEKGNVERMYGQRHRLVSNTGGTECAKKNAVVSLAM